MDLFSPGTDTVSIDSLLLTTMKIVFSFEFTVKVLAEGIHPLTYFTSAWNMFDFVILVITLLPNPNRALSSLR